VAVLRQAYLDGEKIMSELRKSGAPATSLQKARNDLRKQVDLINQKINDFYTNHPLKDKVGVFEGANYQSKGVYRPTLMSLMHGFEDILDYDAVNEGAINNIIDYYTGK
jgi:hypothetical protein